jgi:3-deoxy-D-manno-octulosonate 8-phosphate phosphatase (KDO 8-P phosphatase)
MNQLEKFAEVDTLIFDVDGVFTNSTLLVLESGKLLRQMHTRDGYAVKAALRAGYRVCVITGGKSEGVRVRLQNLGVTDIYIGIQDKIEAYEEYIDLYEIDEEKVLYMGDDLPDYEVMRRVGFPVCPVDSAPEIKKLSQYISPVKGGEGCVREVIERTLKIAGKWRLDDGKDITSV